MPAAEIDQALTDVLSALKGVNVSMHAIAKHNLRKWVMTAMREAIDADLTLEAYQAGAARLAAVALPGVNR